LREKILGEARSWIGTPFHHGADLKGAGVDCAMLLVRVYVDLGLVPPFDPRPYTHDWHLHRGEEKYLNALLARAREIAQPRPGDVAVLRVGRCYSHAGIVTRSDPLTLVHASLPSRIVLEEDASRNADLAAPARKVRFFSVLEAGA
jgi:cell wall-associated NlpC family hydrolase